MNGRCFVHCFARRLHRALRYEHMLLCFADATGIVRSAAPLLRSLVQTACSRPGSPVTPGWPGLRPWPALGAPGIGRSARWSPLSRQRGWAEGKGESKIKGSARDRLQVLVCTWGRTARGRCPLVPSVRANARNVWELCVPFTMPYAPACWSEGNDHA